MFFENILTTRTENSNHKSPNRTFRFQKPSAVVIEVLAVLVENIVHPYGTEN